MRLLQQPKQMDVGRVAGGAASALLRDVEKRPETFVDLKAIQAKVREICTHTDC